MSSNREYIFFWVPKSAGSSIYQALSEHGCRKIILHAGLGVTDKTRGVATSHIDINYLLDVNIIDKAFYQRAFKFGVVRNPWDRLVSLYFYTEFDKKMNFDSFARLVHRKLQLRKHPFYRSVFNGGSGGIFRLFYKAVLRINPAFTRMMPVPLPGPYNVKELSQCGPQSDWLIDDSGQLLVDFLARFENLAELEERLVHELDIALSLPHVNATRRRQYQHYYTPELVALVAEAYAEDIARFDYVFEENAIEQ
ncbi:MAG: hypothetical protein EA392_14735 [Cryomorphaceae bacterium]|nr:MAG: hypothetical protein EA392_14735 [Cryomorphaceae bacterium]